jgi:EAL domain-containing protein (putative c-di-GMP-specific phosphodiesterase class I)
VKTLAEGVETAEEAAACMRAGFSHAQGYYFGRPVPAEEVA